MVPKTMKSFKVLEHDTISSQTTEITVSVIHSNILSNNIIHTDQRKKYNIDHDNTKFATTRQSAQLFHNIRSTLKNIFLPLNYPDSVHPGYIQYQFFDSLQGLCSYLRSIASTTAVLSVAGVGDSEATVTSAVITWAANDGCAMIGGLIFSYYASGYFDSNVKEWRLFADVINDVGLTLEMILPYLDKSYIIVISIIATLCKVMCGIAAGATKSCITQHFAKDNIADVTAKESIQETFVSLIGMVLGISLAKSLQTMQKSSNVLMGSDMPSDSWYIHSPTIATWLIFGILTWIHIWSNYLAVKMLKLCTLNRARLKVALHKVVEEGVKSMMKYTSTKGSISGSEFRQYLISPQDCDESLWDACYSVIRPDSIRLGVRLSTVMERSSIIVGKEPEEENWMFHDNQRHELFLNHDFKIIYICLHESVTDDDILKAYVHGMMLQCYLEQEKQQGAAVESTKKESNIKISHIIQRTLEWTNVICEEGELFHQLVERGWIRCLYLNCDKWRYSMMPKYE